MLLRNGTRYQNPTSPRYGANSVLHAGINISISESRRLKRSGWTHWVFPTWRLHASERLLQRLRSSSKYFSARAFAVGPRVSSVVVISFLTGFPQSQQTPKDTLGLTLSHRCRTTHSRSRTGLCIYAYNFTTCAHACALHACA